MDAFVKLRRGGFQAVSGFLSTAYDDQDVFSGFYRDTGWVPSQSPVYSWFLWTPTLGPQDVLDSAILAPATGTSATPDEQAPVAPRALTWKETRLSFYSGAGATGSILGQFWVRDIMGWSDTAPGTI